METTCGQTDGPGLISQPLVSTAWLVAGIGGAVVMITLWLSGAYVTAILVSNLRCSVCIPPPTLSDLMPFFLAAAAYWFLTLVRPLWLGVQEHRSGRRLRSVTLRFVRRALMWHLPFLPFIAIPFLVGVGWPP